MRYEKAETILRIALDMQGTAEGLSLEDIRQNYSDKPLSRRTAERLRSYVMTNMSLSHILSGYFRTYSRSDNFCFDKSFIAPIIGRALRRISHFSLRP